jgi:hypothetical protein
MRIPDNILPYIPIGFMLMSISLALGYYFYCFYYFRRISYNKDVLLIELLVCLFFTSILYYKLMPEIMNIPTTTHLQIVILHLGKFFINFVAIYSMIYATKGGYYGTITLNHTYIIFILAWDCTILLNSDPGTLG